MIFGQGGICGLMVLNGPIQTRRTYYAVTSVMLTQFIPRKVLHANDASLVFQGFDLWTWCDSVCCWNIWHHCVVAKKGQNFRNIELSVLPTNTIYVCSVANYDIPVHAIFVPKLFFNIHDVGTWTDLAITQRTNRQIWNRDFGLNEVKFGLGITKC